MTGGHHMRRISIDRAVVTLACIAAAGCALDRSGLASNDADTPAIDAGLDAFVELDEDAGADAGYRGPLVSGSGVYHRATVATYSDEGGLVVRVAADVPRERVLDGVTLRLIEGARDNLIARSESQTVGWQASPAATVSEDAALAPDGNTTADRVVTNQYGPSQMITVPPGDLTLSVWARSPASIPAMLRIRFSSSTRPPPIVIAESMGVEWMRFAATATPAAVLSENVAVDGRAGVPRPSDPALAHDLWVWGWQLEGGSFPSSYIATLDGNASRAADAWEFPASSFVGLESGRARIVFSPEWSSGERAGDAWILRFGEDSGIRLGARGAVVLVLGGAPTLLLSDSTFVRGDRLDLWIAPETGQVRLTVGTAPEISADVAPWIWPSATLALGTGPTPGTELFGWISAPQAW